LYQYGRASGTYRRQKRCRQVGDLMGIDHLEDLSIDGKIILKLIFQEWHGDVWT